MQELTVTGQRSGLRIEVDRLSYSVANDLQAQTGSIADALRNVPGVQVDVQGNVSLRGDTNVTILIDGRPSGMFRGEGRGDALQAMPADQIDRVEVITNPSAAFSPEGTAGVINLVTKKNRAEGRTFTVRGNVGLDDRYNGGFSGSITRPGITISGEAGFRHDTSGGDGSQFRSRYDSGLDQWFDSRTVSVTDNVAESRNIRLGVDLDPTPVDRLSAEVRHRGFEVNFDAVSDYEADDGLGVLERAYTRTTDGGFSRETTGINTSWRRRLEGEGHEFVADLGFERSNNERGFDARTVNALPVSPDVFEDIDSEVVQDQTRLKLDYARPLGDDRKLRVGYELQSDDNDYDNFGARGPAPDALVVDPALTNRFLYKQDVHAAYATYERPFGDLLAQFGLRLEQVEIDINQVTAGITDSNSYFRAYPTLNLAWDLGEGRRLSAGYSKRVQRPRPEDLNPYPVYIDPQNLRAGNPDLEPQETQSFEIGYQQRQGTTFYLANVFYRESSKGVTDVVQDIGGGVFLTTRENLTESRSAGVELTANGRLTSTVTYNVGANLFWNEIDASDAGFGEKREGTSLGGRANLNWQPTDKDFFQINGHMMGRRLQAQGYVEPMGMLNLGYRRKVNDRLSLVFTAMNVLDSMKNETVIDTADLRERSEQRFMKPGYFIGFTYSIGDGNGRRRPEPAFDFDPGSGGGPG